MVHRKFILVKQHINDRRLRNPIRDRFGSTKYKVHPIIFAVNIRFHGLDISRFERKLVWVRCGGGGGMGLGWL